MTNVKLSQEEFDLVKDARFILTKNGILQKVVHLFGDLSERFISMKTHLPGEVLRNSPKISRGENYQGLPWVNMDYPRLFSQQDVFAIRCFFWWGNFFSITLQLQGVYSEEYFPRLEKNLKSSPGNWWQCIHTNNPWQHHFGVDNYRPVLEGAGLQKHPFLKIAKKIPLEQWDDAYNFFVESYRELIDLSGTQAMK